MNSSDPSSDISNLTSCLHALQSMVLPHWNGSQPGQVRHDTTWHTSALQMLCFSALCIDVAGCSVSLSDHIKILGVTLDSHLSLDISSICKSAYYHIRSLRHIRLATCITDDMAKSVASSLVCSRLDYVTSLFYGTTQKISIGSSMSKTHLPESLPVTLSDKTHTHLVFLNIFIGFLLNNV